MAHWTTSGECFCGKSPSSPCWFDVCSPTHILAGFIVFCAVRYIAWARDEAATDAGPDDEETPVCTLAAMTRPSLVVAFVVSMGFQLVVCLSASAESGLLSAGTTLQNVVGDFVAGFLGVLVAYTFMAFVWWRLTWVALSLVWLILLTCLTPCVTLWTWLWLGGLVLGGGCAVGWCRHPRTYRAEWAALGACSDEADVDAPPTQRRPPAGAGVRVVGMVDRMREGRNGRGGPRWARV